jgi:hypothetical protein
VSVFDTGVGMGVGAGLRAGAGAANGDEGERCGAHETEVVILGAGRASSEPSSLVREKTLSRSVSRAGISPLESESEKAMLT